MQQMRARNDLVRKDGCTELVPVGRVIGFVSR